MTNGEYRDCKHCAKTYGTLGCCDTVSNEWVYSCKEGHEEYARGMRKFGSTTKNNLGVDCVSRQFMRELGATCIATRNENGKLIALGTIEDLPSVTPQPRKGHWMNKQRLFDSCSAECSSCHKRSNGYLHDNGFSLVSTYYDFCPNCGSDNREVEE